MNDKDLGLQDANTREQSNETGQVSPPAGGFTNTQDALSHCISQRDELLKTLKWIRKYPDALKESFFTDLIDKAIEGAST